MTDLDSWFFAVLAGGALLAAVLFFQSRFIYFPLHYSAAQLQEAKSIGTQEIRFRTSQGNQTAFFWQSEEVQGRFVPDRRDAPISPATAPKNLWLVGPDSPAPVRQHNFP
jgi:hypothetical protein